MSGTDSLAGAAALREAEVWLARHGLDARPTPLLATRLAARRRARRAEEVLLATVFIVSALTLAFHRVTTEASGDRPYQWLPLVVLSALVAGLLVARSLLGRWVRRVDRHAAASLARRATLPVRPGWRAMLGRSRVTVGVAVVVGALAVPAGVLTAVETVTVRYAAAVLLLSLSYVAVGSVVQLCDLVTRPVVAEDETSLTADLVMRIEDARELIVPTAVWSLPVVLLFGTEIGWWMPASLIPMVVGAVGLHLVCARTPSSVAQARLAVGAG
jgi:hypothetical protein